jgi:hypothetical protein
VSDWREEKRREEKRQKLSKLKYLFFLPKMFE